MKDPSNRVTIKDPADRVTIKGPADRVTIKVPALPCRIYTDTGLTDRGSGSAL